MPSEIAIVDFGYGSLSYTCLSYIILYTIPQVSYFIITRLCLLLGRLAKLHIENGVIKPARDKVEFRGSSLYASLNSHRLKELGRVDDVWSLLFVLIDFVQGV